MHDWTFARTPSGGIVPKKSSMEADVNTPHANVPLGLPSSLSPLYWVARK